MVATHDGSARSLAEKLLERPRVLAQIRALIPDPARCHLVPYSTTHARARPRADARHPAVRRRPAPASVRHQDRLPAAVRRGRRRRIRSATRTCTTSTTSSAALADMRAAAAGRRRGDRQAQRGRLRARATRSSTCATCRAPGAADERGGAAPPRRGDGVRAPEHRARRTTSAARARRRHRRGAHRRHRGAQSRACSCASRRWRGRAPLHARPAARRPERPELPRVPVPGRLRLRAGDHARGGQDRRSARARGRARPLRPRLRRRARRATAAWTPYAIEINLRKGGTTHPFLTLQFLTDGTLRPRTALFTAPSGREKHLVATDHLESELLRGLTVDDLFDVAVAQPPALRPGAPDRRRLPHDERARPSSAASA